jgi:hypothetical protein
MKKIVIFLMFLGLGSCTVLVKDVSGVYVFRDKYIIDSLILNKDFSYRRVIFKNKGKSILYSNVNNWSYSNSMLELKKFLNKNKSSKKMINSKDSTFRSPIINTRLELTKDIFGNVIFDIDRYNYYDKVK